MQGKGRAAAGIALQIAGVKIRRRLEQGKTADGTPLGALLPGGKGRIVQVEHGHTAVAQAFENLALGLDDLVRAAELADIGTARRLLTNLFLAVVLQREPVNATTGPPKARRLGARSWRRARRVSITSSC